MVQPLWRTVWRFLRKLKIELPYDPATSLLGLHLDKTIIRKDTCTPQDRNKGTDIENGLEDMGRGRVSWDEVREWHGHIYTTKCKIHS